MFCPKCGTQNPENGKFCRSCGTDLASVSDALTGKTKRDWSGFGTIEPMQPMQPNMLWDKKGKPVNLESAITKLFGGLAFLIISIVLSFSHMGRAWWFWMLIPAFTMLGSGIAQYIQLKKLESKTSAPFLNASGVSTLHANQSNQQNLPSAQANLERIENLLMSGKKIEAVKVYRKTFGTDLKDAKEAVERIEKGRIPAFQPNQFADEYVKPQNSIYDTGDLQTPPSVTESTTRRLEINTEGKTMTLPKGTI